MGRYIEFQIPLIGVTVNSLVVENTSTNNYFVVANASMTDETYTVWFNSHRYAAMGYRRSGEYRYVVRLAQLVEQYTVNVKVGSSILSPGAMKRR